MKDRLLDRLFDLLIWMSSLATLLRAIEAADWQEIQFKT